MTPRSIACILLLMTTTIARAGQEPSSASVREWTIGGEKREAMVIPPSKKSEAGAPVVLVFHGHGGTMRIMERRGFQKEWPEAIVVCPRGLPTKTGIDPEGKRAGWQMAVGSNDDRDLKFVDAILKTLRQESRVDDRRIFATGHSNGAGFSYLLWAARGQEFAAIAPVAIGASALRSSKDLEPMPVIHIAGENDKIVPFALQERSIEQVRKLNGCEAEGKEWAKSGDLVATMFGPKSSKGAKVAWVVHPGTHAYPAEAPGLIVRFFKEAAKSEGR